MASPILGVPTPTLDSRTLAPTIVRFGTPYTGFTTSAIINTATSGTTGTNIVIAGVASQIIRVYRMLFTVGGSTNITFQDTASNAFTGAMTFNSGGSLVLDMQGEPWYICATGAGFVLNSSSAVQISGTVYYVQA